MVVMDVSDRVNYLSILLLIQPRSLVDIRDDHTRAGEIKVGI